MKPDDVVNILKDEWGLSLTRRTVLTYEKDGLAAPPFIETGKYKEYPPTTLAEIIASWGLIHGEYGLRPKKVAEIRKKALKLIYEFEEVWEEELGEAVTNNNIKELSDLVKNGISWLKAGDFFIFNWLMIRMNVMNSTSKVKANMRLFIETGKFNYIPGMVIESYNKVFDNAACHDFLEVRRQGVKDKGVIYIYLAKISKNPGVNERIFIEYLHPEDYVIARPVMP